MSEQTITKSDDIFKKLNDISTETRRWLVGKYLPKGPYSVDFTKTIPIYNGPDICHLEFDFTVSGPKCAWCNSICLLTSDGRINNGEIIPIKSGSYRGQEITVYKHPIPKVEFGKYETIPCQVKSDINPIRNICKRQWMQNRSDNVSHDIAISCLLNSNNYPFRSTTLGSWICKEVNLVKLNPTLGSFKNAIFTPDLFKNTFFQLYMLSVIGVFSHGDPNANVLYLSNIPSSFDAGGKKIALTSTLFLDMSEYSSYMMDYDGRFLFFVGKQHDFNIKEPDWNLEFKMTTDKVIPKQHTKSPSKNSYLLNRMTTFIPSLDIMNYIRRTGMNVFPHLYFIIYMTIALMNRTFYDQYSHSTVKEIYSSIFIIGEYEKYMTLIESHFGETPTCDEIITMLANANIHIRDDSLEYIKMSMFNYMVGSTTSK